MFRAGKSLASVLEEVQLAKPNAIKSRELRKYIATCCQVDAADFCSCPLYECFDHDNLGNTGELFINLLSINWKLIKCWQNCLIYLVDIYLNVLLSAFGI